jgi:hypothetical protein
MNRKHFLVNALFSIPAIGLAEGLGKQTSVGDARPSNTSSVGLSSPRGQVAAAPNPKPFVVDAGKSRFGDVVKFLGVHPNDLKISSKDTDGQLSMFDYVGLAKVGPMLHIHFKQDEVFTRFGSRTNHLLTPGNCAYLDPTNGSGQDDLFPATSWQDGRVLPAYE